MDIMLQWNNTKDALVKLNIMRDTEFNGQVIKRGTFQVVWLVQAVQLLKEAN